MMGHMALKQGGTNRALGHPADARLLIINADDFGMCHAINTGIASALAHGLVRSTTLMTPCPWALHAMHLLAHDPGIAFGVHLTLVGHAGDYQWGPLSTPDKVPSLVDGHGNFFSSQRIPELMAQATLIDVETEFRAQIERVRAAGLHPTHLDWHCLLDGGRPDIFDLTLGLAKEYGLALRVMQRHLIERTQAQGLPTADHNTLDSFRLELPGKSARYAQMLRELPAGLSEWAVHPGLDCPELQVVDPGGNLVRQSDFDFFVSQEAREIVRREGIILLDFRALQVLWAS